MNSLGKCLRFATIVLLFSAQSCRDRGVDPPIQKVSQILQIRSSFDSLHHNLGTYTIGVWSDNKIYCSRPYREITLDGQLRATTDTIVGLFWHVLFIAANPSGTKLLLVRSLSLDVSIGSLYERNLASGSMTLLRDSTSAVSSARYLHASNKCIYYSYGSSAIAKASGYYLYDLDSGSDSLLFAPTDSPIQGEVLNGFDISPDDRTIVYPIHSDSDVPRIAKFDLQSSVRETLAVTFSRQFVWLRYDSQGKTLLYSNYNAGAVGHSAGDTTETGIIDPATLSRRVIGVNTLNTLPYVSVNIFPDWSSDGKSIVYSSAPGPYSEPLGTVGEFSLYVLTNVK